MYDIFPSDGEAIIMLVLFAAVCICAWELLSWLISLMW